MKEKTEKKLEELKKTLTMITADGNKVVGAIQVLEELLREDNHGSKEKAQENG